MKVNINVKGNEAVVEGEEGAVSKFLSGVHGKIKINTPFGKREVSVVKKFAEEKPKAATPKVAKTSKKKESKKK